MEFVTNAELEKFGALDSRALQLRIPGAIIFKTIERLNRPDQEFWFEISKVETTGVWLIPTGRWGAELA